MSRPDETTVSEAELLALFRPRRVDPAEFRARVERRIRERESGLQRDDAKGDDTAPRTWRTELARRAAALIPIDPTGAAGGAKLASATLFLPFLVLAATFGAFAAAFRSVRRSASEARPLQSEPSPFATGMTALQRRLGIAPWLLSSIQIVGTLLLLGPIVTASAWAIDLQIAVFLLAGVALVLLVRALAESALLTPRMVSRFACAILGGLFAGTFLWMGALGLVDYGSDLGSGWAAAVVVAGIVVCALLGGPRPAWSTVAWIAWAVVIVVLLNPLGVTHTSPASLRDQLARFDLDATDLSDWESASELHEALARAGAALPDRAPFEAEIDRALANPELDVHPQVWTTALRMGLMTPERWSQLATRGLHPYQLGQLLKARGPLSFQTYGEYQVPLLLATRDVTGAQREYLVERVDATWPGPTRHDPLQQALLCVRLFEHLGATARVDSRRADVHAMLVRNWIGERTRRFGRVGGFTSDPAKFQTSFEATTYAAVALMARFGVPPEIDLRRVRGFLRNESRATPLVFEAIPTLKATQRAALLRLEREVGIPPRSWIATLVGERLLVAALLLVILCVAAIRSAPSVDPAGMRGALP